MVRAGQMRYEMWHTLDIKHTASWEIKTYTGNVFLDFLISAVDTN